MAQQQQVYKATYSSVPVYEMPCQGVAVMRRKADAWLNATQILKVAGFDKPQRTRVLEREVQKGTHEKVQGGYGKYQGTWVPMERGIALARQYGVDRLLQTIFDYIPTADSPPLAPKHITAIPTRPKKKGAGAEADGDVPPINKRKANAAANAAAAASAAAAAALAARKAEESEEERIPIFESEGSPLDEDMPSEDEASSDTPSPLGSDGDLEYVDNSNGANRKRKHQEAMLEDPEPAPAHAQLGLGPLRYARMILDYFVSESTQVPSFLVTPPPDFDANVVIDDDGHTALHWACAMGRIRIVKLLLTAGADIFRANAMGQTALMRSVMFTNNYDLRKFPELFELLHRSTINIDRNDRTVFHYIVDIALQKGKSHAARYYMENVLSRLTGYPKEVADILNFQDEEGETALTLAARARSKRLVKILLDNGADPKIANRDNKTAEDYILEDERFRESEAGLNSSQHASSSAHHFGHLNGPLPQLHTSEVAQRTSTTAVPQVAALLESLASSFDAELLGHARDLAQATTLLGNIEAEILESQRTVAALQAQSASRDALDERARQLESELENRMGKRFRLGWEKWVRDEDAREQAYEAAVQQGGVSPEPDLDVLKGIQMASPSEGKDRAAALRAELEQTTGERKRLFKEFAHLQSGAGTGQKMAQYRQLIALGCGVPLDQVDTVLDTLVETLDARDDGYA